MGVLVIGVALFGLVYATTLRSVVEVKSSRSGLNDVRAKYLAQAGVERGKLLLQAAADKSPFAPINGLTQVFDGGTEMQLYLGEELLDGSAQVGSYSVSMTLDDFNLESATITIESTGYLPTAPGDLGPGEQLENWCALSVTMLYELQPSSVFDYSYFINNWGWFYGSTIFANGNAGSNAQFDVAGYHPTITGQPIYDNVAWDGVNATLSGYRDDNGDGLQDGNDGGIFSGWDILGAHNVNGVGGNAENQHDFQDSVPMPNLSDLSEYEKKAIDEGSSISIGGSVVSDAVYGDGFGELGNLYLHGTVADPIVIDGPVVVQGDVIISGYVSGQGAIYTDGNVYVPDSINYLDPPTTERPADNTQASTEAWLSTNWNKDFLGLFASENVVVGDFTDFTWQWYVGGWMSHSMNKSSEDSGEDGVPNTLAGKDGILDTEDDDVLEGDGVFTVEYYTAADYAMGLIPPGKVVGDVIPGTGEDIDGDGMYDDTTTLSDLNFQDALDSGLWGGNMPFGLTDYGDISSLYANHLDATFYTNHAFCYVVFGSTDAEINGAVVSRNESIVYGTPTISINHDSRLLGGNSGVGGGLLPQILEDPTILRWTQLDADPNLYGVIAP